MCNFTTTCVLSKLTVYWTCNTGKTKMAIIISQVLIRYERTIICGQIAMCSLASKANKAIKEVELNYIA